MPRSGSATSCKSNSAVQILVRRDISSDNAATSAERALPLPVAGIKWRAVGRAAYVPLMLAPAMAVLIILFAGGLLEGLMESLGNSPSLPKPEWTLRYYQEIVETPGFYRSLLFTFYIAFVSTTITAVISIYFALALRLPFRGKVLYRIIYKLPLMVPHLAIVYIFTTFLAAGGIPARIAYHLGIIGSTQDWPVLINDDLGIGILLVYIWNAVPWLTIIVYAVMLNIDSNIEDAAVNLGAGRWQVLRYVLVPLLMPGVMAGYIMQFAFAFGDFVVPLLMGKTYPNTLQVMAYQAYVNVNLADRPFAMAITIANSVFALILLYFYVSVTRRMFSGMRPAT